MPVTITESERKNAAPSVVHSGAHAGWPDELGRAGRQTGHLPSTATTDERGIELGLVKDSASKRGQYMTEVNKGSVNMSTLTDKLNDRYSDGWRLHTMLEQDGNTVMVFERRA